MKHIYILFLTATFFAFGNNQKPIVSKIEKVTVYLEGASIERSASVNLIPGENTLIFNNLSPDIDERSLQISGLDRASVLSLNFNVNYLEKKIVSEEYKTLKNRIDELKLDRIMILNSIIGY